VVVGAQSEDSQATGVNGNESDNSASFAGAAYVFRRSGVTWSQEAYLKASNTDAGDFFGCSVSLSDDTAVVGALFEDSRATGVNGYQSDNNAIRSGAAYIFGRSGGTWSHDAYLKASNTNGEDYFGHSVSVSGDTVLVGAYWEASKATGVDGDELDNSRPRAGAVYVFRRSGALWSQEAYLKASNTGTGDQFGHSVSVAGDTAVIGAICECSGATGVNGDQSDNSALAAGAAYVFDLDVPSIGTSYCGPAAVNSSGLPGLIRAFGSSAVADNYVTLVASQLPIEQLGYFISSQTQGFIVNPGGSQGNLCLGGSMGRHLLTAGSSGSAGKRSVVLDLTQLPTPSGSYAVQAGETWNFQLWFHDNNPGPTSNFTDGVAVTFN